MSRIRNVALLLPALVLATGLASAQPGIKISQVDPSGQVTHSTFDPSAGPVAKAPTPGPQGTFKYWDGLPSTNYYLQPNYTTTPPSPQIAVGPDDILTIVNRTIARYPNPNAAGNTGAPNPYAYPPTHAALIDAWFGIAGSGGSGGNSTDLSVLCPTAAAQTTCFIDNISIRYDQLQGRFVVLATVTDLEQHLSNWVLLVSRWANFACSTTGNADPTKCQGTSDLFTPPIVPVVGGPSVGGFNTNWLGYAIPINVVIPTTTGLAAGTTIGAAFCPSGGSPLTAPTGGGTGHYNDGFFGPGNVAGTITSGCTNYYPTAARMGLDNDNIILLAPVLDQTQVITGPSGGAGLPGGAFAGTRVTTVPKLLVYNGISLPLIAGPYAYPGNVSTSPGIGAINLYDDVWTGTLTGCSAGAALGESLCTNNPVPGFTAAAAGFSGFFGYNSAPLGVTGPTSAIPPIFWEPDVLRGRALASFNAQVGISPPTGSNASNVNGVITPLDYLVGLNVPGTPGGIQDAGFRTNFWVQPIVFSCPATFIFGTNSGVTFCGTQGGGGGQVPDLPALGRGELLRLGNGCRTLHFHNRNGRRGLQDSRFGWT